MDFTPSIRNFELRVPFSLFADDGQHDEGVQPNSRNDFAVLHPGRFPSRQTFGFGPAVGVGSRG
jgi:hypothetical protein